MRKKILKKWQKKTILLLIVNLALIIFLLVYQFTLKSNVGVLWAMWGLELASTIAFSYRIWYTSRAKFFIAALIGCVGWTISGAQGLLLIKQDLGFGMWVDFALKLPSVLIATFSGIYLMGGKK